MIVLKSVEEEAAECRARCAGMKVGDLILHCHHEVLCEILSEPVENRINYILRSKSDNPALRLRLMVPPIIDAGVKADAELNKARAKWSKADAELNKARAKCSKARAEWSKACGEWSKTDAEWSKIDAELSKAYAEWSKADAECRKADAECRKADAECSKAYAPHYSRLYPDSPWNGKTIFAGKFAIEEA